MNASVFEYQFADSSGRAPIRLRVVSPEGNIPGKVTFDIPDGIDSRQYNEIITECEGLASALKIKFTVENDDD